MYQIELETNVIRRFGFFSIVSYSRPSLMIIASVSQFHVNVCVLNVKAVVATFNQEKALVGAFSVIIHHRRLIVYTALLLSVC